MTSIADPLTESIASPTESANSANSITVPLAVVNRMTTVPGSPGRSVLPPQIEQIEAAVAIRHGLHVRSSNFDRLASGHHLPARLDHVAKGRIKLDCVADPPDLFGCQERGSASAERL